MDEPPVLNGRVSSRELYTAISSLREELGSAQRAQAADVMAAVAATEQRLAARIDCLEATVNAHDDILQQLEGREGPADAHLRRLDAHRGDRRPHAPRAHRLMAAYGTDSARYLPPHTSQLATKLSADGVDDCLVCSTLALVNGASLGEATRTPVGHEPSSVALVRTAVRMRKSLDDTDTATKEQQHGPLPPSAAGRMVALMWPAYPTLRTDDIDFKTLVALLGDRHLAVLAGNPSHITGHSPLKRVGDVGHAIALLRARQRKDGLEMLVDDPFRAGGKHLRGEWVAARQVRQFAFHDSDSTLTAVWVERYGAWTAESLARRRLTKRIDRIEEEAATAVKQTGHTEQRLRARIAQLEAGSPLDCGPVVAEALDAERVAIRDLVETRRSG